MVKVRNETLVNRVPESRLHVPLEFAQIRRVCYVLPSFQVTLMLSAVLWSFWGLRTVDTENSLS